MFKSFNCNLIGTDENTEEVLNDSCDRLLMNSGEELENLSLLDGEGEFPLVTTIPTIVLMPRSMKAMIGMIT